MLLPRFQLLQPKSIEQATELLGKHEAAARIMAGGTDVLPRMKYGLESPGYVIGLSNLPVFEPVDSDGFLLLDSLMSLTDVARSEIIRQNAFGLAEAAMPSVHTRSEIWGHSAAICALRLAAVL